MLVHALNLTKKQPSFNPVTLDKRKNTDVSPPGWSSCKTLHKFQLIYTVCIGRLRVEFSWTIYIFQWFFVVNAWCMWCLINIYTSQMLEMWPRAAQKEVFNYCDLYAPTTQAAKVPRLCSEQYWGRNGSLLTHWVTVNLHVGVKDMFSGKDIWQQVNRCLCALQREI